MSVLPICPDNDDLSYEGQGVFRGEVIYGVLQDCSGKPQRGKTKDLPKIRVVPKSISENALSL